MTPNRYDDVSYNIQSALMRCGVISEKVVIELSRYEFVKLKRELGMNQFMQLIQDPKSVTIRGITFKTN